MRALITNDDGVDSPGIQALTAAAVDAGLDVVVAAPGWDSSGASASLTAVERDGRLVLEERSFRETSDVVAYAVEAAPAFIVCPEHRSLRTAHPRSSCRGSTAVPTPGTPCCTRAPSARR